jgi:hypothetical protein
MTKPRNQGFAQLQAVMSELRVLVIEPVWNSAAGLANSLSESAHPYDAAENSAGVKLNSAERHGGFENVQMSPENGAASDIAPPPVEQVPYSLFP